MPLLPLLLPLPLLARTSGRTQTQVRGNVIHYGPANPDEEDREVVFICLSPRDVPAPDTDRQRYPHGVVD
jgi:hypothetical protein